MMGSRSRRVAMLGLFTTVGLMLGYIESLLVLPVKVPGFRIGISNIVTVVLLYSFGPAAAFIVLLIRVILSGILFGNGIGIFYSLSGAVFSFAGMFLLYRSKNISCMGVSVAGGMLHNIGQILCAVILIGNKSVLYYLPALILLGDASGLFVGFLSNIIIKRISVIKAKGE